MGRYRKVDRRPPARTGESAYTIDVLRGGSLFGTAPVEGDPVAYIIPSGGSNAAPCIGGCKEDGLFTGEMSYKRIQQPAYYVYKHANGIGYGISSVKGEPATTAPWGAPFAIVGPFVSHPPGGPGVYVEISA